MRTQDEIDVIISQSKQGYSIALSVVAEFLEKGKVDNFYLYLSEGKKLLDTIQFAALTLAQKNLIADRLIRNRFLANQQMIVEYVESDYWNGYVKYS